MERQLRLLDSPVWRGWAVMEKSPISFIDWYSYSSKHMQNKNEQSLFYILNCLQNVQESQDLKSWLFYWQALNLKLTTVWFILPNDSGFFFSPNTIDCSHKQSYRSTLLFDYSRTNYNRLMLCSCLRIEYLCRNLKADERFPTDSSWQQLCFPGRTLIFYRKPCGKHPHPHTVGIDVLYSARTDVLAMLRPPQHSFHRDESCCQEPNIPGLWAYQGDEWLTGCNYTCKQQAEAR